MRQPFAANRRSFSPIGRPFSRTMRNPRNVSYLCAAKDPNMERHIDINDFDYDLPDERIAKFPLAERSAS